MLHKRACCQFSVCIILHGCNAVVSIACPREDMRFCRPAQKLVPVIGTFPDFCFVGK